MLEESGLPYQENDVDITQKEQFKESFLKISPNNKIPAIFDPEGPDKKPISLFESGAILMYLAEKTQKFLPKDRRQYYEMLQWLMFQMAGLGPMLGQYHYFKNIAPVNVDHAIERYKTEGERLHSVMEKRLQQSEYLGGREYSIADMASWPWIRLHERYGFDIKNYPALHRWVEKIGQRPAVQKSLR